MIYFKDNNNAVFAYAKSDLLQVDRATELETLIHNIEPTYFDAVKNAQDKKFEFESSREMLNILIEKKFEQQDIASDILTVSEDETKLNPEIEKATLLVNVNCEAYEEALAELNEVEAKYAPLKMEYETILPVFFEIREHLKGLKKMTSKEVDAHLNPPISKEQLIAEAEQQKQSLLAEANNAIAPLKYAVDLGMVTDEEKAQLTAWKKYLVLLNRVDTSLAPALEWPNKN